MKNVIQTLTVFSLFSLFSQVHSDPVKDQPRPKPQHQRPHTSSDVYLSSPRYSFEVDFTGLYMQPTASNLDYAAQADPIDPNVPIGAVSPNWVIHQVKPEYHFGFDVRLAGIFHETNSSLMLDWEWFHSPKDTNSTTLPEVDMIGPFFEIGPDASFYKQSKGHVRFHFDEVSFDYGTFIKFGDRLKMNVFGGVAFTRILQRRDSRFASADNTIVRTIKVPSKFTGAGPQAGTCLTYRLIRGFQLVGDAKASLFMGTLHNKTTFSTTSAALEAIGGPNPNVQTTTVKNRTCLVPGFEGKIGLAYDAEFNGHYMIKMEVGYQAQVYLNSIRSIDLGSEVALSDIGTEITGATGVYARTFQRTISDFSLAGLYFSLDFGF